MLGPADIIENMNYMLKNCSHCKIVFEYFSDYFIRAFGPFNFPGNKARIMSPPIKVAIFMCLSFRMRTSSSNVGYLQVCKQFYYGGNAFPDCSLWSSRFMKINPNFWTKVQVQIQASETDFNIMFEMTKGQNTGYIDVDDVQRFDGNCLWYWYI